MQDWLYKYIDTISSQLVSKGIRGEKSAEEDKQRNGVTTGCLLHYSFNYSIVHYS